MRIAVFTGSAPGHDARFMKEAAAFASALAKRDIGIVYGGAHAGLMGTIADTALGTGGEVIGVIPQSLVDHEIAHRELTDLHIVDTMHERKKLMADLSDAFIALPGGVGTLEELFEAWTWLQLGIHHKPVAVLNINDFWTSLLRALEQMAEAGFVKQHYLDTLIVVDNAEDLIVQLEGWPHRRPGGDLQR